MDKNFLTDRITGIILLIFALWYMWQATLLNVPSIAIDTLGPKTFPLFLGGLLAVLSLYLILKPDPNPPWPTDTMAWLKMGLIIVSLVAYGYLIEPLGFIMATTLEMTALAYLFKGSILKALISSLLFSVFLFFLFSYLLSLRLPIGIIFAGLGG